MTAVEKLGLEKIELLPKVKIPSIWKQEKSHDTNLTYTKETVHDAF